MNLSGNLRFFIATADSVYDGMAKGQFSLLCAVEQVSHYIVTSTLDVNNCGRAGYIRWPPQGDETPVSLFSLRL